MEQCRNNVDVIMFELFITQAQFINTRFQNSGLQVTECNKYLYQTNVTILVHLVNFCVQNIS